jgi:hypothetical protein
LLIAEYIRITYLNRDFTRSSTGIEFYQAGKTTTINDAWHLCNYDNELEFKTALHQGRAGTLNVYLYDVYEGFDNVGTFGWGKFPENVQNHGLGKSLVLDGVVNIGFNLVSSFTIGDTTYAYIPQIIPQSEAAFPTKLVTG